MAKNSIKSQAEAIVNASSISDLRSLAEKYGIELSGNVKRAKTARSRLLKALSDSSPEAAKVVANVAETTSEPTPKAKAKPKKNPVKAVSTAADRFEANVKRIGFPSRSEVHSFQAHLFVPWKGVKRNAVDMYFEIQATFDSIESDIMAKAEAVGAVEIRVYDDLNRVVWLWPSEKSDMSQKQDLNS
jgi:hypothetical protein